MSKNPALILVIGLVVGCGAAMAAPLVVPPAHAQTTQRWEMYCVTGRAGSGRAWAAEITRIGVQAGREGWEPLSASMDGLVCFKRPAAQ